MGLGYGSLILSSGIGSKAIVSSGPFVGFHVGFGQRTVWGLQ